MALSKTNRDGTRQIGGARAWWAFYQFRAASSSLSNLTFSLRRRARWKSSWLDKSCFRWKYLSPKEASPRFVARPAINADDKVINRVTSAPAFFFGCSLCRWLDKPCAACTRRRSPASTCNMARSEFDRSSWSSTSMMTDRSPDVVFQLRKSKTTTKRRLGITEAFVSETILSACGNSACDRGTFAPSLAGMAVRNSSRSSQSRAEHRKSISLWTSATCLVPVGPRSYSVGILSDVPSAPEQEVVLQVEEEGMISAVVEMRCVAAYKYKYRLYREGWPLDEEEDKELGPSWMRELILDKLTEPG